MSNRNDKKAVSPCGLELLKSTLQMQKILKNFRDINNSGNGIAMHASIESARTHGKIESFATVAEQIHAQTTRSNELGDKLENYLARLQNMSYRLVGSRYYELAECLMNKLDRSFSERVWNVQIWSSYQAIIDIANETKNWDKEKAAQEAHKKGNSSAICKLLMRFIATYSSYEEIIICNASGLVVSSGRRRGIVGSKMNEEKFFTEAKNGTPYMSDVFIDPVFGKPVVAISHPIYNAEKTVVGVIVGHFNWSYAQEIVDGFCTENGVEAFFVNSTGTVIAKTDSTFILRDSVEWLDGGQLAMKGMCGSSIEQSRNGVPMAIGFTHSVGYGNFSGKKWSTIVTARFPGIHLEPFTQIIEDRSLRARLAGAQKESAFTAGEASETESVYKEYESLMLEISRTIKSVQVVNNETNMLAINAAIQAGVAGIEGEGFAVIASELGKMAERIGQFVQSFSVYENAALKEAENTVRSKLADAAYDIIDKVNRLLFERICNIQAWSILPHLVQSLDQKSEYGQADAALTHIYNVSGACEDIFLLETSGKIIGSAARPVLKGQIQSGRKWFQEAMMGRTYCSDLYYSETVGGLTVAISAPVIGIDGSIIGVLTTRLNWKKVCEILEQSVLDASSSAYLLDEQGKVIGASDPREIMKLDYGGTQAFREVRDGKIGTNFEKDPRTQSQVLLSYATTIGYGSFAGKGWSAMVMCPIVKAYVEDKKTSSVIASENNFRSA